MIMCEVTMYVISSIFSVQWMIVTILKGKKTLKNLESIYEWM